MSDALKEIRKMSFRDTDVEKYRIHEVPAIIDFELYIVIYQTIDECVKLMEDRFHASEPTQRLIDKKFKENIEFLRKLRVNTTDQMKALFQHLFFAEHPEEQTKEG